MKNAKALCEGVKDAGFRIVSGGTDNHLFLTDVFSKGITGKDGQNMLEAANITVNKNTIPFDKNKPMVASGLRIGTPAVTTRGLGEPDMKTIAGFIARVLDAKGDETEELDAYLQAFGSHQVNATRSRVIEGWLDRGAAIAHEHYNKGLGQLDAMSMRDLQAATHDWADVLETYRAANRAAR